MNKNTWLVIGLVIALGLLVWLFATKSTNAPEIPMGDDEAAEVDNGLGGQDDEAAPDEATVTYTDDGFSPATVTVAQGGTVHFVNQSSNEFWPASAVHPTHAVYPGSGIELCGTLTAVGIFDACGGVAVGSTWSFTFDEVGQWGYHDHLNASHFGKVVVE